MWPCAWGMTAMSARVVVAAAAASARLSKTQSTVSGPGVQTDIITLHREGVEFGQCKEYIASWQRNARASSSSSTYFMVF